MKSPTATIFLNLLLIMQNCWINMSSLYDAYLGGRYIERIFISKSRFKINSISSLIVFKEGVNPQKSDKSVDV